MTITMTIILICLCFLLEGFFSGSEIALVSADRMKLQADAERGRTGAKLALGLLENPARSLGTCLVGTNLCTITAATLAANQLAKTPGGNVAWAVLFVLPFTLTIGEMIPKALYQHHADRLVQIVVFPLRAVAVILTPVLFMVEQITRILGGPSQEEHGITREGLKILLEDVHETDLTAEDRQLLERVFAFPEGDVQDAMVPLISVKACPADHSLAQAMDLMIESSHSRLPIYQERIDRICGLIHHHDLLRIDDWSKSVASVMRPPLFVPESMKLDALLMELKRTRQHMAVAVDEYGGGVGIITIEDLLEEIVGEIQDESDNALDLVRRNGERQWIASGRAEREHLEQACLLQLPEGDFETLAGFVLSVLGRIPRPGESVQHQNFSLTVSDASDRAILEVRIDAR